MSRNKIDPTEACKEQYLNCRMECPARNYDDCIKIHIHNEFCAYDDRWGPIEERCNSSGGSDNVETK